MKKQSKVELQSSWIKKIIKQYTLIIKDNIWLQSVHRNEIPQINQKLN